MATTSVETLPTREDYNTTYETLTDAVDALEKMRERVERFVITWHDSPHEPITYDDVGKLFELHQDVKMRESVLRKHRRGLASLVDALVAAMADGGAPPFLPSRLTYSGQQLVDELEARHA